MSNPETRPGWDDGWEQQARRALAEADPDDFHDALDAYAAAVERATRDRIADLLSEPRPSILPAEHARCEKFVTDLIVQALRDGRPLGAEAGTGEHP